MDQETKLLIADADPTVREIIGLCAKEEGWLCDNAQDGISALKLLRRSAYHLAILETELPEVSGYIVCRHLRKSVGMPVIFISRHSNETSRIAGFEAGGNDYVIKPFYPRELVLRVKNLLSIWGHTANAPSIIKAGDISLNLGAHQAMVNGSEVKLTPKEFDLLLFFMRNQRQAFSGLAASVGLGTGFFGTDRTVDTHVKSLRGKILPARTASKRSGDTEL